MFKKLLSISLLSAAVTGFVSCNQSSSLKEYKGLFYKVVKAGTGKAAQNGDLVEFQIIAKVDTQTLANSWKDQSGNTPVMQVRDMQKNGEWPWIFQKLKGGDSVEVEIAVDTMLKYMTPEQLQNKEAWMKKGAKVKLTLSCLSVSSEADYKKKLEDKKQKQLVEDDKALQDYFAKNNLKPTKTASGLYYTINQPGSGPNATTGKVVSMDYTGKLMDGRTFDSNVDSNFHHKQEFKFPAGGGRVIAGWDEGVMLLNKGAKATFYIPSSLAYGPNSMGIIPPNANLIFDVEVKEIAEPTLPKAQAQMPVK